MLTAIRKNLSLYLEFCRLSLATMFAFRLDAGLRALAVFVREITSVAVIWLVLSRFPSLGGWDMNQMLFLFSYLFLTYSILIAIFTGFRDFEGMVYSGEFDRFLLRPRGLMFQVVSARADYLATMGHAGVGILLFCLSAGDNGIIWDAAKLGYLFLALAGGVLIQGAIFVFFSSLSLWFIKSGDIFGLLYYNTRRFAGYPLEIFPAFIQNLLIFVVPFAFVNYFPSVFLLGKTTPLSGWSGLPWLTPVLGVALFGLAYAFWRRSTKAYASTGNG